MQHLSLQLRCTCSWHDRQQDLYNSIFFWHALYSGPGPGDRLPAWTSYTKNHCVIDSSFLTSSMVLVSYMTMIFITPAQRNRVSLAFLVQNLGTLILARNFAIILIWGSLFQIWQYCFQLPAQNYRSQALLVPNLRIFIFVLNFAIRQIQEHWLQTWQESFKIAAQNTQIMNLWHQI